MIKIRYDQTLKTSASGKMINSIVSECNENMPLFQCVSPYEVIRYTFLGNCPPNPPLSQH